MNALRLDDHRVRCMEMVDTGTRIKVVWCAFVHTTNSVIITRCHVQQL